LLTNTPSSESSRASCSRLEFEQGSSLEARVRAGVSARLETSSRSPARARLARLARDCSRH